MTDKKLIIDSDKCQSCGLCVSIEPEVFDMDYDNGGIAFIKKQPETDKEKENVEDAIGGCAFEAIFYGE